jgi:hypothetical protein
MLNWAGRIACISEAGGYAVCSIAIGRVTSAVYISTEEPDKVSYRKGVRGAL